MAKRVKRGAKPAKDSVAAERARSGFADDVARMERALATSAPAGRPSALIDTRVIYCGDCLEQLQKLPDACVDLIYIDPPFNSNRNYEVFWGETREKRAFEDRHASTESYINYMRPRCVKLLRAPLVSFCLPAKAARHVNVASFRRRAVALESSRAWSCVAQHL